jgi:hypothetical protein
MHLSAIIEPHHSGKMLDYRPRKKWADTMCDLDYNVPKVIVRQTETSGLEKYAAAQPHHLLRQTMTPRFQ